LITAYIRLVALADANFVLQKLGSVLVTLFAKPDSCWKHPLRHIFACLISGKYVPEEKLPEIGQLLVGGHSVSDDQVNSVLLVSATIAEDLQNRSLSTADQGILDVRVAASCLDALHLLRYCSSVAVQGNQPENKALQLLQNATRPLPYWIYMIKHADSTSTHALEKAAVECISVASSYLDQDSMTGSIIQMLTSLEQSSARLLRLAVPEFPSLVMSSEKAQSLVNSLVQGDFSPDAMLLVDLLDAIMCRVDTTNHDYLSQLSYAQIVLILRRLLRCEGVAVIEDPVCQVVLQWLAEVVEGSTEWEDADTSAQEFLEATAADACDACFLKIKLPHEQMSSDTRDWDPDERAKFRDFRSDVHDFYQSAYPVLGERLLTGIVQTILGQEETPDWALFEAAMFSLMAFLDVMSTENGADDAVMTTIFDSPPWRLIQSSRNVPDRALQTSINFVAENVAHFQQHTDRLIPILNFLFSSLHVQASTSAASRAIYKLCDSNREILQDGLPQFIGSLGLLDGLGEPERHRVYAAVAAVIYALPEDLPKLQALMQILAPIQQALERLKVTHLSDEDEIAARCTDIVQTLASIGRGLRSPTDTPIDLDATNANETAFWIEGQGSILQREVLDIYYAILRLGQSSVNNIFIDACCDFIKSGFTESHPSPFKFSDPAGLQLIAELINVDNPSIDTTLACATSYLASVGQQNIRDSVRGILYAIVPGQQQLLSTLRGTRKFRDTSFPSASLDFLARLLGKWGSIWFEMEDSVQTAAVAMELALLLMADADTLPRRSAAAFFASFADFSGPDTEYQHVTRDRIKTTLDEFAARILSLLLWLVAGECARSELEALSETLRRFAQKQTMLTRAILKEAIKEDAGVMSDKAIKATTMTDRNRFVAQIEALRGARKTTEIVKNFWISCKGSGFGYVA
jgi:hypothetical protein